MLAAQGASEVASAQQMDLPEIDFIDLWPTDATTQKTTAFLTQLGTHLAGNRTEGALHGIGSFFQDDASNFANKLMGTIDITAKQKQQIAMANEIIDMAGAALHKAVSEKGSFGKGFYISGKF